MRIIIIYNKDLSRVISRIGRQNIEIIGEQTVQSIKEVLLNNGFDVRIVDGNLDMFEKLRDIISEEDKIPFVFNLAYGIQGESRYSHIPSILEMLGLPYLGSGPAGHTLALNKVISKILMKDHDIPTPLFWKFNSLHDLNQEFVFPVILKPAMEAGSFGVKISRNRDELKESASVLLKEFSQTIIAERFISGREFAMGIIGNGKNIECLPLVELDLGGNPDEIYTSDQKKNNPLPKLKPADVPDKTVRRIEQKAKELFSLLQIRDYARIDIRMDANGDFWFLEINSMASLSVNGSLMAAAGIAGYTYQEMILKLLDIAVCKYFRRRQKLKLRYESSCRGKNIKPDIAGE
jgi:D-alanine-D-alanine ligase